MRITHIDVVQSRKPVPLPELYRPAWNEPDTKGTRGFHFGFYQVHTDEGIVGIGPYTGQPSSWATDTLIGQDPANARFLLDLLHERVQGGAAVIMVNHAPRITSRYASRILFINGGRILLLIFRSRQRIAKDGL